MIRLVVYQLPTLRWKSRLIDPGNGQVIQESPHSFADRRDAERSCSCLTVELIDGPHIVRYEPQDNDADPRSGYRAGKRREK